MNFKKPITVGYKGKTEVKFKREKITTVGKDGRIEVTYKYSDEMMTGFKGGDRKECMILRPEEINAIIKVLSKGSIDDLSVFKMMLLLGCRYEEARRIQKNPKWWDGDKSIEIEEHKVKRVTKKRYIILSDTGKQTMPYFLAAKKMPTIQTFDEKLKRWGYLAGLDNTYFSARSLRKTWESWLISYYPELTAKIVKSQGHTLATAIEHYIETPFTTEEINEMKTFTDGWFTKRKE
jgi:integrase